MTFIDYNSMMVKAYCPNGRCMPDRQLYPALGVPCLITAIGLLVAYIWWKKMMK